MTIVALRLTQVRCALVAPHVTTHTLTFKNLPLGGGNGKAILSEPASLANANWFTFCYRRQQVSH